MSRSRVRVEPSPVFAGALELVVDDRPQSVVDPANPARLHYDYAHRVGGVLSLVADPGAALRVLHVGGGAMTLARHVAALRPGSRQVVIENDPDVVRVVGERMPLGPAAARSIDVRTGDAAALVPGLDARFDVAVVDAYVGLDAPGFAASADWYRTLAGLVPDGIAIANVVDDGDLASVRLVAPALADAFGSLLALGPADLFAGERGGNVVLVGGAGERLDAWVAPLRRIGPHPATVLGSAEAARTLLG
ncbi:spermidine synthase [Agromyces mangrovi Wang et al. 2018]|uniref:spermidine synthase n=1 Tax=Agromyces mangrovi TaxID=1858653 RepID=UPI0025740A5A|nr:fused MFS/spermidine synthase [Agromyces mangrovi]BDZ63906.1 hypothetical protein GCM10025877_08440 [Agromyces mangrovi]